MRPGALDPIVGRLPKLVLWGTQHDVLAVLTLEPGWSDHHEHGSLLVAAVLVTRGADDWLGWTEHQSFSSTWITISGGVESLSGWSQSM